MGETLWLILFISSFSNTFHPVLRRPIGRNLNPSSLYSFPGYTVCISLAVVHLFGKTPIRRQPLYMAVIYLGKPRRQFFTLRQLHRLHPGHSFYPCLRLHSWFPQQWSLYRHLCLRVLELGLWLVCGVQCVLLCHPMWSVHTSVFLKSSVGDQSGFRRVVICVLFLLPCR